MVTAFSAQTLESAFDEFNHRSNALETSYRELQREVSALNSRLVESRRSEVRHIQEKGQLTTRLTRLLEILPGAIVVIDGDGIIFDCNRPRTGYSSRPSGWLCLVGRRAA